MAGWREVLPELLSARGHAFKRYAYLLCGNNDEADDLVQEALVKVLSRMGTVDVRSAEAYVKRVIANEYLDRVRSRRVWSRHVPRLASSAEAPDWSADSDRGGDVWRSLLSLSPRQRACVVLRFYEDLTVPEVARTLQCSEGAVKRYLNESMARLRPRLSETT